MALCPGLEYLGRNDDQVKIRGMRIELGEIEARLNQLPGIQEAVVVAREDQPGQPRLVAYFTGQEQVETLETGDLRAWLQAHLPDYMVPAAYVKLAALPLTANGKIDRRALPKPELEALFTREYEAPEGELETTLAQIWSEVLHVDRVGRRDHFFELGGHSLLAMRMVAQVRQRLGVELALAELFANAELAAVAQVLSQAARSDLPQILPVPREDGLPLSFAQQRLWFLAQMGAAGSAYNIPVGLGLRGPLDRDALQRALARIVERHETLRSRFVLLGEEPQVHIAPLEQGLVLDTEDLREEPRAQERLQTLLAEETARPFDLQYGPLIRGRLIRMAEQHHVLLLTLHHIVSDGWSMGVLTRELMALYEAFRHGQDDPLPPLAVQYGDFAVWQRRWLGGELLQQQSAYWQQALAGAPPLLMLPTDRPRPARQEFAGGQVEFLLDERLSAGLRALGQRHGTTLYMTLLAGWAMLLSRLSGQDDLVIGSPVANRQQVEVEGLVGLFVNTLAIRLDLAPDQRIEALLAQVRQRTLAAQAHQDLPFEQVVDIARPQRSLAHSPLFQTMLSWQSREDATLALGELQLEGIAGTTQFAKFDLALNVGEVGAQLAGALTYATALFDATTIERYVGYLRRLLQAMVDNDQVTLGQASLLDEQQRQQLLQAFNASQVDHPVGQTLAQRFEAQVERTPEAIAVQVDGEGVSYRELNQRANRLAHRLIRQGVQVDSRVALCIARGPHLLVGMLAILKAGAGYVPVDPAHPQERIDYLLQDSAPLAVLVQDTTRALASGSGVPLINLDQPGWHEEPQSNPQVPGLTLQHLAYVIYTSGSTGQPKGVMVEHGTVENLVHWHCTAFDLRSGSHTSSVAGLGFDAMAWEVWPALCVGATLHLPPADIGHQEIDRLLAWWQQQPLDVCFLATPIAEHVFTQQLEHPTLRTLLIGGDRLRQFNQPQRFAVINNYGPTEATVVATSGQMEIGRVLHIGKPIANAQVYLLDEELQAVPVGVAGELYIGGAGVARGYLNRPEMTAERFIDDPFSAEPQARLYRTGDQARWLADGNLDYLGRNDDQLKIRGVRIEPGEIEAALSSHEVITEAVVLVRDGRLVAWFTASEALAIEALNIYLHGRLPEYMVPSAYVQLDALPLTANGKLDRRALPAPDQEALLSREFEAPQGAVEVALATIWAQVLKVERVGRNDHFFELGGHSLSAVILIERMRQVGLNTDVRVLFSQPTLAALAAADLLPLIDLDQASIDRIVATVPGGAANVQDIYPLAPLQEGILYHHMSAEQGDPYLLQAQLAFDGLERLQAFAGALQQVIQRHDILRTSVLWEGLERPVQVVWRQAGLPLWEERFEPASGEVLDQLLQRFEARHYRLDIRQAPLMQLGSSGLSRC